ncbi:PHD finger protein ING2 isoform X2 [Cryptomeria japonica]|uniref:PHD finger protein ING2 isoform X2 n=1 Tax=Cryptomeria japonica TaxID=3369 RepID=UPI0025ACA16A|nr:PHD finger protein ING2 isoform X2 [Cryptomeria japonica]
MAVARTGVYVDDYLDYVSTLPAEIQRLLSTMRELDDRSNMMLNQTREQIRQCLSLPSQSSNKASPEQEETIEKLRKDIEGNQENILNLSTEKLENHMKRLDEDLLQFAEDLKQEGKIGPDEPAILPLISSREERKKSYFFTTQTRKLELKAERDWEKDRDRDFELMPPPGSHRRTIPAPVDVDQPNDPNEPTYCVCHEVSFGDMIACDNENCEGGEWFHYACVGLTSETRFKGKWYCPTCKMLPRKGVSDPSI